MRNLTRLTVALMATIFLVAGMTAYSAVGEFSGMKVVGALGQAQSTLDANPVIWVKYIGDNSTANVEVDATTGDIEFTSAAGVDTTVACPEGDDDGVIDVSNAACDTWIEVVNACNQADSDWACVLGPVRGDDATTDALATLAATDEDLSKGLGLFLDDACSGSCSGAIITPLGLYPPDVGATTAASGGGNAGAFFFNGDFPNRNPFKDKVSAMTYFSAQQTSTGTIALTNVFGFYREYRGNPTIGYDLYERIRTVWSETGGATTVVNTTDFSNFPLLSGEGEFLALETGSSTNFTAVNNVVAGALLER